MAERAELHAPSHAEAGSHMRLSLRGRRGPLVLTLLACIGGAAMLFPFLWMVSTSFTDDFKLFEVPPQLVPSPFRADNYRRVTEIPTFPVWRLAANSLGVAAVATFLQVATSAMGAYAFARLRFRGRDALFLLYLTTLMVPFQVTIVPLFIEMRYLGLVDSYPGLIVPGIASAFGTFLLRQAFMALPKELEEAAFVDGFGHWTVFTRIVLPLSGPALATLAILAFMASWNSFLWPLVVVNSLDHMTLPLGLANLHGQYTTQWNLVMAATTLSVVPILLVYLAAQRHIVRGFAFSGLKG
jgi:multiple sugar transport system permease protein